MSGLNLSGHFLVAMPFLESDVFEKTVIYVCEHDENGAYGVIVNQLISTSADKLLGSFLDEEIDASRLEKTLVYFGGPVNMEKGFVLHSRDKIYRASLGSQELLLTGSREALVDYLKGEGPEKVLLVIGHAVWGKGQLEEELHQNVWLTVRADLNVIFNCPVPERYYRALKLLGFEPELLFHEAGHA